MSKIYKIAQSIGTDSHQSTIISDYKMFVAYPLPFSEIPPASQIE